MEPALHRSCHDGDKGGDLQIGTVQKIQRRQPAGEEFLVDSPEGQNAIAECQQNIKDGAEIPGAGHMEEPSDVDVFGRGVGVSFLGERPNSVDTVAAKEQPTGEDGPDDIEPLPGGQIE